MNGFGREVVRQPCVQAKVLRVPVFLMVDLVDEHRCQWEMEAGHQLGERLLELQHGVGLVAQDLTPVAHQLGRHHQGHRPHMAAEA